MVSAIMSHIFRISKQSRPDKRFVRKEIDGYLLRECLTRFLSGAEEIKFTDDMALEARAPANADRPRTHFRRESSRYGKASNHET